LKSKQSVTDSERIGPETERIRLSSPDRCSVHLGTIRWPGGGLLYRLPLAARLKVGNRRKGGERDFGPVAWERRSSLAGESGLLWRRARDVTRAQGGEEKRKELRVRAKGKDGASKGGSIFWAKIAVEDRRPRRESIGTGAFSLRIYVGADNDQRGNCYWSHNRDKKKPCVGPHTGG